MMPVSDFLRVMIFSFCRSTAISGFSESGIELFADLGLLLMRFL